MQKRFALAATLAFVAIGAAGCLDNGSSKAGTALLDPNVIDLTDLVNLTLEPMMFTETIVDAAIGYTNDLYEPTMEVSNTGVIYVTGHTIGVDTTGAPVFFSRDNGTTWDQLPFTRDLQMPAGMHGATPPVSDEIFVVAGDDGFLYGVDITAFAFPVNAWGGDGAEHVYYNPNAYDREESTTAVCGEDGANPVFDSAAASLNDRPWAAYGNGKLLMVNNPGGGPAQFGVMDVPMDAPYGIGGPAVGPQWNVCGSTGGYIPGIPDMRDDHFFAIPQTDGGKLHLVLGNAEDIYDVKQRHVVDVTNAGGGTSNYGQVVFDQEGTMFVGIRNNTGLDVAGEDLFGNPTTRRVADQGQLIIATSTDNGETFVNRTVKLSTASSSIYLDGNMNGAGALLTWAQTMEEGTNWYAAHLTVGPDGEPVISNPSIIVENGPGPSAHVQGAALGPDGRAHIVTFHGGYMPGQGTPLHVWVQNEGSPVLSSMSPE